MGMPQSSQEARVQLFVAGLAGAVLVALIVVFASVFASGEKKPHELNDNMQERWARSLPAYQASGLEHKAARAAILTSEENCQLMEGWEGDLDASLKGVHADTMPDAFVRVQMGVYLHCPEYVEDLEEWVSRQQPNAPYWLTDPATNIAD